MRYQDYATLARKVAGNARHRFHHVVAIALKGGAIQGWAVNRMKQHAETRAIRMYPDATVILVYRFGGRKLSTREARDSCPCGNCALALQQSNIRQIIYMSNNAVVMSTPDQLHTDKLRPWKTDSWDRKYSYAMAS